MKSELLDNKKDITFMRSYDAFKIYTLREQDD